MWPGFSRLSEFAVNACCGDLVSLSCCGSSVV